MIINDTSFYIQINYNTIENIMYYKMQGIYINNK